ncbi:MAG TPA: molybdate ABC transporter permease subunit [Kofleriaceae bacterium]|nr:molybdate ABC transporter permease subunit [Kofleriaceae bacterium]
MDTGPLLLSLEVAAIATMIAIVLGVALGALLAWKKTPGRDIIDAILTAPMVLPPTVLGYYLLAAIGRHSAIGRAWKAIFDKDIVFTVTGCIVASTIEALPMVIKSSRTAIEGVDPTLIAAARTLGAGPVRAFFTVTLPLAAPGIIAGATLGFARALGDFGVTLMIAGDIPGETQTAPLYIYDQVIAGHDNLANGMALLLTAIAIAAMYLSNTLTRRDRGHH